jgi:Fe(3+) dicitrate transport protein
MKYVRQWVLCISWVFAGFALQAQCVADTLNYQLYDELVIGVRRLPQYAAWLPPVQGTFLHAGKKSELVDISRTPVSLAEKHGRQLFAQVPGVFVYDMDGTGNQLNISTRGLDPHRSWEFNVRKDQVITNTDMFGYPASHYNIPMEAVERIELVRGTGSLQYGAQFGGMLNIVMKEPDTARAFSYEGIHAAGSFGLLSTFHRIEGSKGKFSWQAWGYGRQLNGYRAHSASQSSAFSTALYYRPTNNLTIRLEWTRSIYQTQLPGPLTDSMFGLNPNMATRTRNYYSPDIHVPSLKINGKLGPNTDFQCIVSAVLGSRNSVMFDRPASVPDTLSAGDLQYAPRQVDIDRYRSLNGEFRVMHRYQFKGIRSELAAGVQGMQNALQRKQQGTGSKGKDYDLGLVQPEWGRDVLLDSRSISFFAENRWIINPGLSVTGGMRYENGRSDMSGVIRNMPSENIPARVSHRFPLFAAGFLYARRSGGNQLYGGWSEAYRPVLFKDIIPASVFERVDPNLRDAKGYNAELGMRGRKGKYQWDISAFILQYRNRPGTLVDSDSMGNFQVLRTNIGNSLTQGLECFLQRTFLLGANKTLRIFTATSLMHATYTHGQLRLGNENVSIANNRVESVPRVIARNGMRLRVHKHFLSMLSSFTSGSYADPFNRYMPDQNGTVGWVPAYHLVDIQYAYRLNPSFSVTLNVSNAANRQYFTKRPQFYPGPGIWPSDGRSIAVTVHAAL